MDKQVKFDRVTRDWNAYLDGAYIGSFNTPGEAQEALSKMQIEFLRRH